ncbi:cat eye syndrome critical region protein 2 homolog [Trichonephila inaurata madagascariensis]|uniref:Cat eye syndrome critical region protein 2 homolog n=1 Tax=Trichonephila inaurata madagascariensis TaxID=2747483 RepID=A0A8X6MCC1_9ARAC|nr:cat eye syndrome critical region protein 2 homolog [Trichonephila inaurata madagascariensis]
MSSRECQIRSTMNIKEPSTSLSMEDQKKELQSMWKVPAIASIVSLCHESLNLPHLEIESLEDGLLKKSSINFDNFTSHLLNIVKELWISEERNENIPLSEETSFENLDISTKVDLLYSLCMNRLDQKDAVDALQGMAADSLRVTPLGCDALGNEYWYFYGTRLYKQEPSKDIKVKDWEEEWNEQKNRAFCKRGRGRPKKNNSITGVKRNSNNGYMGSNCNNIDEKSRWSLVCHTFDDWIDFAAKFQDSTLECEQALFHTLKEDFLPALNKLHKEKGRRLQEKLHKLIVNSETRKMLTRKQKNKSNADNGHVSDDSAHREYLARNRADRLEKRNRLNENEKIHIKYGQITAVTEISEEFQIRLDPETEKINRNVLSVLKEVKKSKEAKEFQLPVDETEFPDYYKKIKEPICLSDITSKVVRGCYQSIKDIDDDFKKMVSNCCKFNGENHPLVQDAKILRKLFREGIAKFIPQNEIPSNHNPKTADAQKPFVPLSCKRNYEQNKEQGRKKKKNANVEALEILSKEAELAVEAENGSGFSGLKILPIHSHPSSLIEKFMSDTSNEERKKSSENNFTLGAQQESNSSNFRIGNLIPKGKSNAPNNFIVWTQNYGN